MKQIKILFGDQQDSIVDFLIEIIEKNYNSSYDFNFISSFKDSEIIEFADNDSYDIFILYLNNIIYSGDYTSSMDIINKGIEFVSYVKERYNKPIIAFSSFNEFAGKAEKAGAISFIKTPFQIDEFVKTFCKLLNEYDCDFFNQ